MDSNDRDKHGKLNYLLLDKRLDEIRGMKVFSVVNKKNETL